MRQSPRRLPVRLFPALRASWIVALCIVALALPAAAQQDWGEWDDDESEGGGFGDWAADAGNRASMGANSLITFGADPFVSAVFPREEFSEIPMGVALRYPVGFVQGTLLGAYRAGMGTLDLLFSWLTPMKMLSPQPRYNVTGAEHDLY